MSRALLTAPPQFDILGSTVAITHLSSMRPEAHSRLLHDAYHSYEELASCLLDSAINFADTTN